MSVKMQLVAVQNIFCLLNYNNKLHVKFGFFRAISDWQLTALNQQRCRYEIENLSNSQNFTKNYLQVT